MSSKHDPILLLEPSNLLEPLSLEDRYNDAVVPRPDREGTQPPTTARPIRRPSNVAPSSHAGSRWRLKAALIVAGGLACFGAGAAMPMLPNLGFGDAKRTQPIESAARPTADTQVRDTKVKAEAAKPAEPAETPKPAEVPKPAEPKLTEKPAEPITPPPMQAAVPTHASDELAGGPNETAPVVNPSAPAAQQAVGSGAATRPAAEVAPEVRPQEERSPPPRSRRAAQRDAADQGRAVDNAAVADQVPSANFGERRQDRDAYRGSSRRRDRTADSSRGWGQGERWGGEEPERGWGERSGERSFGERSWRWGRDRYADERAEGRRAFGRAMREDDGPITRGPRFGGPGFFLLGDD